MFWNWFGSTREILKAIIDRNGAAAYEKTRRHLENTRRMYQRVVDKAPALGDDGFICLMGIETLL